MKFKTVVTTALCIASLAGTCLAAEVYTDTRDPHAGFITRYEERISAPYTLTDSERLLAEQVVMAEAGGELYEGQMLVAQCILNAVLKEGVDVHTIISTYGYTKYRKTPSESVKKAVSAVFDYGEKFVEEEVLYFYAPALCASTWHESQTFVIEFGGGRFFAAN